MLIQINWNAFIYFDRTPPRRLTRMYSLMCVCLLYCFDVCVTLPHPRLTLAPSFFSPCFSIIICRLYRSLLHASVWHRSSSGWFLVKKILSYGMANGNDKYTNGFNDVTIYGNTLVKPGSQLWKCCYVSGYNLKLIDKPRIRFS